MSMSAWRVQGWYLWLWGADKQVPQAHGSEQAICPRQVGVCLDHKGVALHEGPQVNHGL